MCTALYSVKNWKFIKKILESCSATQLIYKNNKDKKYTFLLYSDMPFKEEFLEEAILGTIILENNSLLLQASDADKLKKGKQLLQDLLGIAAKHEKDEIKKQNKPQQPEPLSGNELERIAAALGTHYKKVLSRLKNSKNKKGHNKGKTAANSNKIYQFKITLKRIRPPIWRRIQVKSDITFDELHRIIQAVMGWCGYHLYSFTFGKGWDQITISDSDEEDGFFEWGETFNSRETTINSFFEAEKEKCIYTYDFGDNWEHQLLLEKILEPEEGVSYPVCIKGKRACPPEDCGGIPGYYHLLEIVDNPEHEEYEMFIEWLGGEFDPEEFDLEEVNQALREMYKR